MFVSSFSTYITSTSTDRTNKSSVVNKEAKSALFASKLSKNLNPSTLLKPTIPTNYISEGQTQHNKQMIELDQKSIQNEKKDGFKSASNITKLFSSNATLQSAKVAYSTNSTMFSLLKKPTATLNQTPKIDNALPLDIQEIKENNMRNLMVNTYLANDKYYQITA